MLLIVGSEYILLPSHLSLVLRFFKVTGLIFSILGRSAGTLYARHIGARFLYSAIRFVCKSVLLAAFSAQIRHQ